MDIQNAYNEWADIYDTNQNLTRDLDSNVTRELLAGKNFDSILELGCGTGKNTVLFAQIGRQVHALDFSSGMIEKAKEKVSTKNIRFEMADLTKHWPCENQIYDLASCNLILEHIKDLSHIFSEAHRTLRPSDLFLVNELHPFKQYRGTKARYERASQTVEVEAFIHHISDFTNEAIQLGFKIAHLNEYWHPEDDQIPPRLISFLFIK